MLFPSTFNVLAFVRSHFSSINLFHMHMFHKLRPHNIRKHAACDDDVENNSDDITYISVHGLNIFLL